MAYEVDTNDVELMARNRFSEGRADADSRRGRYELYHRWYAPPGGDQWPEDILERPDKIHITANIVKRFCDTEARLLSIMPRFSIESPSNSEDSKRAEIAERTMLRYLTDSGIGNWYYNLEQSKSIYGIGVLKPFWNAEKKQPDVVVVEQPQNIMFGWGDSDYSTLDWAIYHYGISKLQAQIKYPDFPVAELKPNYGTPAQGLYGGGDHADPLGSIPVTIGSHVALAQERGHLQVWDYWYLDKEGKVWNAILINGYLVDGPYKHTEMPAIPYIPIEHDHEPGSPEGRGTAELLIDIQDGLNRALSHYAQYVWDNSDPAYQLTGEGATNTVPDGLVPRPGEIVAPGQNARIELINMGVNNFPFDSLINTYWNAAHRITGLSEILFGSQVAGDGSGRSTIMQIESSINALQPKRDRSYEGLKMLIQFWHYMSMKKNVVLLEGDGKERPTIRARDVFDKLNSWKIIAPEITPRNIREHTQNTIDKMNARLMSTQTGMSETGIENPLEEIELIKKEATDAQLYPERAQAIAAVMATMQAIAQQEMMARQQQSAQGAAQEGQAAQDAAMGQRQQAQPTAAEDQNQVAASANGIPPGEASPIGGQFRPIVRQTPGLDGSQAMSEIRLPVREF